MKVFKFLFILSYMLTTFGNISAQNDTSTIYDFSYWEMFLDHCIPGIKQKAPIDIIKAQDTLSNFEANQWLEDPYLYDSNYKYFKDEANRIEFIPECCAIQKELETLNAVYFHNKITFEDFILNDTFFLVDSHIEPSNTLNSETVINSISLSMLSADLSRIKPWLKNKTFIMFRFNYDKSQGYDDVRLKKLWEWTF